MKLEENLHINLIKDGKLKIIYDFYKEDLAKKTSSLPDKNHWQNIKTDSVTLGVNVLLIRKDNVNVLIDTGIGTRTDYSFLKKYEIDQPRTLLSNLKNDYNLLPEDINYVILTHLHFDHSGGSSKTDDEESYKNKLIPAFPNATYLVSKDEYNYALEQSKKEDNTSFFDENFIPIQEANRLKIIDYDSSNFYKLLDGISIHFVGGHTKGFQYVKIKSNIKTVYFVGDIVPTPWHVNNTTFPGVDYDEEQLLKAKHDILEEISENDEAIIVFQHSPSFSLGKISKSVKDRNYKVRRVK